jgi:hypothetical protein
MGMTTIGNKNKREVTTNLLDIAALILSTEVA